MLGFNWGISSRGIMDVTIERIHADPLACLDIRDETLFSMRIRDEALFEMDIDDATLFSMRIRDENC